MRAIRTLFVSSAALALVCGVGVLNESPAEAQAEVTIETIVKAWKERQDKVRSARFSWTERETITKGYVTDLVNTLPGASERLKDMGIPPGSIVPPNDTTHDVASTLSLDGNKLRYWRDTRQWCGEKKAYVTQPRLTAFDGTTGKTLYAVGSAQMPWPQGLIQSSYPDPNSQYLSPLATRFRAFLSPVQLFDVESLALTNRKAIIDGKSCLELEQQRGTQVQRVWVDPAREFVLVRFWVAASEQPRVKIDIRYRKDDKANWVPEIWEIVTYRPDGKLERSARAKVTAYEINSRIEPAEFEIEFPPGTCVHDRRDPKAPVDYIVKEGGKKRIMLPEERRATYEQIINSEPGEALGKRKWSMPAWLGLVAAAVMVVAGGLLLRRRWFARKQPVS